MDAGHLQHGSASRHAQRPRRWPSYLTAALLVAACGSASTASPPSGSGPATSPSGAASAGAGGPTSSAPPSGVVPSSAPVSLAPSPPPMPPLTALPEGTLVVTVSDRLRVRSLPEVSDESVMYQPLLPLSTELVVLSGPVSGSEYIWYLVEPVSFRLADGISIGWVAAADHDGEPWIAPSTTPAVSFEFAKATATRSAAKAGQAQAASASIADFGLALYRQMLADPQLQLSARNAVMSPTSIVLALAMARAGARGETAAQMDAVLRTSGWDALGWGLNAVDQALAKRDWSHVDEYSGERTELTLRIANTAFAQRGWPIEQDYLDALAATFGAGLGLVDFKTAPDAARRTINAWVSEQTKRRIPELLKPAGVTEATRLVLVNAVYLKAWWEHRFFESATAPAAFTRLDGSRVQVPTMHGQWTWPYAKGDGWQATELGYVGAEWSRPLVMTLIRPDDIESFEKALTAERMAGITAALAQQWDVANSGAIGCDDSCGCHSYDVDLAMPRFSTETRADLVEALAALGMRDAFDPSAADFSGITTARPRPFIKFVIHQANIDVDEKGTEAAAATAVGFDVGGCTGTSPVKVIPLRLDRPFLFAIRDVETGAILFLGRVVDPSVGR